jgi:Do/DeqQ family serine protease
MPLRLLLIVALLLASALAAAQTRTPPTSREIIHLSFAPVVKKVAPAVVNVFSRRVVRSAEGPGDVFNDPFFRQFFGNRFPLGIPRQRVENSLGSGVILDAKGLIVTNHHVIKDAEEVLVVLPDRREFDARIILTDPRADLAVLKIDPAGETLPVLEMGDSDSLEVGDLVLAVGNPFGVGQTVTSGIVSGLARTIGVNDFRSFIQTDAAINPGNSGGALVDLDGGLVGINTAIFSRSGGSVGIGFAIPVSLVRPVLAAAAGNGHVVRPWLGASAQAVTGEIAHSLGLPKPEGVLIKDVAEGGPAARAGIHIGDVLLQIEGHAIDDPESLRYRVATMATNTPAQLTYWRAGQIRDATISVIPPPEQPPRDPTRFSGRHPLAGAAVANLNPALTEERGLDTAERGVIVTDLAPGSLAERVGLAPGDIVISLNNHVVESVEQLQLLLGSLGAPWVVTVKRGDEVLSTPPLRG